MRSGPSGGGSAGYAATTWSATWRREIARWRQSTAVGGLDCHAVRANGSQLSTRKGKANRMAWTAPPAAMNRRRLSAATYASARAPRPLAPLSLWAWGLGRIGTVALLGSKSERAHALNSAAVPSRDTKLSLPSASSSGPTGRVRRVPGVPREGAQSTRRSTASAQCKVAAAMLRPHAATLHADTRASRPGVPLRCTSCAAWHAVCQWWLPCVTGCADPSSPTLPAITSTCAQPPRVRSRSSSCTI